MIISEGNHIQMSLPVIIYFNPGQEFFPMNNFQISKPYFINGLIKLNISWTKIHDPRIKQYDIHWIEHQCYSDVFSCCYRRDAATIQNHFQLYDLRFNCTYLVNINAIGLKLKNPFQFYFNVSSCESIDIHGSIRPPCQTDRKTSKRENIYGSMAIESIICFLFLKLTFFHHYRHLILLFEEMDQVLIYFGKIFIQPVRNHLFLLFPFVN